MSAQLKIINNDERILTYNQIVDLIKNNAWESVQKINLDDFVHEVTPGNFIPKKSVHFQSRPEDHNPSFVQKKVIESKNGKTHQDKSTIVYFPEETIIHGKVFPSNSFLFINGIHGALIDRHLGILQKDANIINFQTDLNSEEWKVNRIANLLNVPEVEEQPLEDSAICTEIHNTMERRAEQGLDPTPSDEERERFMKDYPQLNKAKWSNYVSSHKLGGRRDPAIIYTDQELKAFKTQLENMSQYEGYHICTPSTVSSYDSAILGRALLDCCEKETKKLLMPLYSANATQTKSLRSGKLVPKIKRRLNDLKEFLNMDDIAVIIMKY